MAVTTTLRELIGIKSFVANPTTGDIKKGLIKVKQLSSVQKNKQLVAAIDASILALTALDTIVGVYETIMQLYPVIKKSVDAGAAILNPTQFAKIAADATTSISAMAVDAAQQIPSQIIEGVLNTEITLDV